MLLELHCREFRNSGFTVLYGMTDRLLDGKGMQTGAGKPDEYPRTIGLELNKFVLSIFSGEKKLKVEQNCD